MITIKGANVIIRDATAADDERLAAIAASDEVTKWWGPDVDVEDMLVIERDGQVVGGIQYDEETDEQYRHAGIDVFLDADHHGQGIGEDAVRTLARWLFQRGHHRVTIDPRADNEKAIRCYEKVGFRPVGVMRKYEMDPWTGEWHDGLLMDLLAEDLDGFGA